MRQIDDPVRLRRRAANLERELAAAPARESTLAFLRGILEEVRFALDSPLEESGFELSVPLQGYSDQVICDWSWRSLLFGFGLQRCNRNLSLAWTASLGLVEA